MATGQIRIGFLYIRRRPAGLSESGPFNKTGFLAPKPGPRAPAQNHKPRRNPEISHQTNIQTQKSVTNPQTQNQKSHNIHVIFLAIIAFSWKFCSAFYWKFSCHPNGCQDLTNQSVQKIQQIPEIKLANLKIPATKHQKNPANLAHKKKKNPNPNFAHKNTKRKKPKSIWL